MKKQLILSLGLFILLFLGNCNNLPESSYAVCNRKCEDKKDICYVAIFESAAPPINYLACETYKVSCETSCGNSGGSKSSSRKSSSITSRTSSSSGGSKSSSSGSHSSSGGGSSSSGGSGGSSHQILTE